MLYNKPYGAPGSNDPYVNGDPSIGRAGSIPPAEAIEYPQREIANLITDAGITPSNSDLRQLGKAIQSGKLIYGVDSGTANNVSANLTPTPTALVAGMVIQVKMLFAPTGNSVANFNSLGSKTIVKSGSVALSGGEWLAGDIVALKYDGTNFQCTPTSGGQKALATNLNLYVNTTTGSDTLYDGSAATVSGGHGPFKTIQHAVVIAYSYAPSQFAITINVADGTYTEAVSSFGYPGPTIILNGNVTTPANVLISSGTNHSVLVSGPNTWTVQNLKVQNSGGTLPPGGFVATAGATLNTSNTISGAITGAVFEAFSSGNVNCGAHIFNGSCAYCWWSNVNGVILFPSSPSAFTFASAMTVNSTAFASQGGTIAVPPSPPAMTNPGNVTGTRYSVSINGTINTLALGGTYFPGTIAGASASGGQYV